MSAMLLRLGLNFGAHLVAGVAFGALAAYAVRSSMSQRAEMPELEDEPIIEPATKRSASRSSDSA